MTLSLRGVRRVMEKGSPGHFTSSSVQFYKEFLEKITDEIMPEARSLARLANRSRVDVSDLKLAMKKFVK